jgi:predicted ribosomally synthesized peptide with nif11-like leader
MAKADAEKFLHAVDTDPALRHRVASMQHIVELGNEHGFKFSNEELNQVLEEKWGKPENRKDHPDPYTCGCFSEPPGF